MKEKRASKEDSNRLGRTGNPGQYEIRVDGRLDAGWSDWFPGMRVTRGKAGIGMTETILRGEVPDQSALRGILCKLWDLGLTVLQVRRLPEKDNGRGYTDAKTKG